MYNRGASVIEVLVYASFMATVLMGASSMFTQARKNQKQVTRKLEALSLEGDLQTLLSENTTCTCNFQNFVLSTNQDFNAFTNPIRWGCANTSTIAIENDHEIESSSTGLHIGKIGIANISEVDSDTYSGEIQVFFTTENGDTPLRPIKIKKLFDINTGSSTTTSKVISSCGGGASQGPIAALGCAENQYVGFDADGVASCKNTTQLFGSLKCTEDQVVGFNADGNTICTDKTGGNNGGNGGQTTCPCGTCYQIRPYPKSKCGNDDPTGEEQCLPTGWSCIDNNCGCTDHG